jgi:hypothetical protein
MMNTVRRSALVLIGVLLIAYNVSSAPLESKAGAEPDAAGRETNGSFFTIGSVSVDIRNSSGKRVGYIDGNDVRNASGSKVGYIDGNDIRNASGSRVGYIDGSTIRNASGGRVGYMDGSTIRNASGSRVGYIDGAARVHAGAAGLLLLL